MKNLSPKQKAAEVEKQLNNYQRLLDDKAAAADFRDTFEKMIDEWQIAAEKAGLKVTVERSNLGGKKTWHCKVDDGQTYNVEILNEGQAFYLTTFRSRSTKWVVNTVQEQVNAISKALKNATITGTIDGAGELITIERQ